jgi:hypothetical protein
MDRLTIPPANGHTNGRPPTPQPAPPAPTLAPAPGQALWPADYRFYLALELLREAAAEVYPGCQCRVAIHRPAHAEPEFAMHLRARIEPGVERVAPAPAPQGSNAEFILSALAEASAPLTAMDLAGRAVGTDPTGAFRRALKNLVLAGQVRKVAERPERFVLAERPSSGPALPAEPPALAAPPVVPAPVLPASARAATVAAFVPPRASHDDE